MGRYTTVQNFSDNGGSAAIPYDKATGGMRTDPDAKGQVLRVPVVHNVMGSAAGAGSGLFHIYRHERRREMSRLKSMEEEHTELSAEQAFRSRVEHVRQEADERTRKRADKRRRRKEKSRQKKRRDAGPDGLPLAHSDDSDSEDEAEGAPAEGDDARAAEDRGEAAAPDDDADAARRKVPTAAVHAEALPPAGATEEIFANDGGFFQRYLEQRRRAEVEAAPAAAAIVDAPTGDLASQPMERTHNGGE